MSEINFTKGIPVINEVRYRKPDGVRELNTTDEEEPLLPNGIELNSQEAPGATLVENEEEHLIPTMLEIGEPRKKCADNDDDDTHLTHSIV